MLCSQIHELFDLICGTSTGGLLALGVGLRHMSLDAARDLYLNVGRQVFGKPRKAYCYLVGKPKYPTKTVESVMRAALTGDDTLTTVASPKVAVHHAPPQVALQVFVVTALRHLEPRAARSSELPRQTRKSSMVSCPRGANGWSRAWLLSTGPRSSRSDHQSSKFFCSFGQ